MITNLIRRSFSASLSNLKAIKGSTKKRKVVGRGIGSGSKHCGRGNNGQNSKSGATLPKGFQGGQTPIWKTIPKRGHQDGRNRLRPYLLNSTNIDGSIKIGNENLQKNRLTLLNLNRLQHLIDTGRIDKDKPITIPSFSRIFNINKKGGGIKIMGAGSDYWREKGLIIMATLFSPRAIETLEKANCIPVSVWHNYSSLKYLIGSPKKYTMKHLPPLNFNDRLLYSDWSERGYLNTKVQSLLPSHLLSTYCLVDPISQTKIEVPSLHTIKDRLLL